MTNKSKQKCIDKYRENFNRKLALTISETGTFDYGNCELENIINSFIEAFERENTIDAQSKVKGKEPSSSTTGSLKEIKKKRKGKDKKLKVKKVKIEQLVKLEQGIVLLMPQEESHISNESNIIKDKEQKFETLGQWLDNKAFDIFAVRETNLDKNKELL
ncbi:4637_t:CDS:2 [Gigaspora margarita]|uniref:4637_t:CDS:1 n=1 Tax=Gigaspora margarita TaxID=4874 RepID=A0ABN7V1B7_GIGMA|nr:4637_t:CDS:2 [Gigaspora margarita]